MSVRQCIEDDPVQRRQAAARAHEEQSLFGMPRQIEAFAQGFRDVHHLPRPQSLVNPAADEAIGHFPHVDVDVLMVQLRHARERIEARDPRPLVEPDELSGAVVQRLPGPQPDADDVAVETADFQHLGGELLQGLVDEGDFDVLIGAADAGQEEVLRDVRGLESRLGRRRHAPLDHPHHAALTDAGMARGGD